MNTPPNAVFCRLELLSSFFDHRTSHHTSDRCSPRHLTLAFLGVVRVGMALSFRVHETVSALGLLLGLVVLF